MLRRSREIERSSSLATAIPRLWQRYSLTDQLLLEKKVDLAPLAIEKGSTQPPASPAAPSGKSTVPWQKPTTTDGLVFLPLQNSQQGAARLQSNRRQATPWMRQFASNPHEVSGYVL
jgi:hypothetical protein